MQNAKLQLKIKDYFLIFLFVSAFALLPRQSSAHLPVFKIGDNENFSRAQEIFEPETAQMIFGRLQAGKTDFYKFKITDHFNLHIQILTPKNKKYSDFRPALAILGPGLKKTEDYVPFLMEEGLGTIVLYDKQQAARETFFDYGTLTRYFKGGEIRHYLTEPGDYRLAVFDLENQPGAYAIRISDKENPGLGAILGRIKGILKIKLGLYQ